MNHGRAKKVTFCGTRGIPANYGGFETAVDEISKRFAERGYETEVFCRRSSSSAVLERHEGRELAYVTGSASAKLDTFVSALQTGWRVLRRRKEYEHVFWFNNANLPGILLTLLARIPTTVNTDGMEWRRAKWKLPFKVYYVLASLLVSRLCRSVVSDSRAIQDFYRKVFLKKTQFVPYGIPPKLAVPPKRQTEILEEYGVEPGRYLLQITRFEPDNLALDTVTAFRDAGLAGHGLKFLLVGYQRATPYAQRILEMSGEEGCRIADAVYDPEVLAALRENCFCYVHGNTVGGTNPALLEAMSACPRVLAIDLQFSRELLGDTGYFFRTGSMAADFRDVLDRPDRSSELRQRAEARYQWDAVAESYMRLAQGKPADYSPSTRQARA